MDLQALSTSLREQGVKHCVVIAEAPAEESKLREFFEHFVNVFPKFRLWNVKDLKAGAKYGLTTIKPFLAGEMNQAQLIPHRYQLNPVLTVDKFPQSETQAQAKKLVREIYGPHLKKTLDAVYGLRAKLHPIETKDEYGAIVEFEDAGKPMRATLKITSWSKHGDETELAIYVTINNRRVQAVAAFTKKVELSADLKRALDQYKQELAEALEVVGKPDAVSDYIDKSKYIVFVDRYRSHNVWLDKETGIAYEGKSGPSCNLSMDIANIKDGPTARAKIIMQHMNEVRFAPRSVLDSMSAFNTRRTTGSANTSMAATSPEKIAEDKILQGKFQQELGTIARSIGFTDVSSFVIDISKNHNTCYAVALYLKPYISSGGPTSYKMVLRRDKDTVTEYDPDMIAGQHGMSKAKLGSFKMSKLHKELEGIFLKQGK